MEFLFLVFTEYVACPFVPAMVLYSSKLSQNTLDLLRKDDRCYATNFARIKGEDVARLP